MHFLFSLVGVLDDKVAILLQDGLDSVGLLGPGGPDHLVVGGSANDEVTRILKISFYLFTKMKIPQTTGREKHRCVIGKKD